MLPNVGRVSHPEHDGLETLPNLGVAPVFTEHVRRIDLPTGMTIVVVE
jgi:hypothetical protein